MRITTDRLAWIASTVDLAQAEINDRAAFARLLGVRLPEQWPPPLNDADSMQFNADRLREAPEQSGWWCWYLMLRDNATGEHSLIGNGGLKGPPTPAGVVEIGYSILPQYQGSGYGTEAVEGLVRWAFTHPPVSCVVAETLPELKASIRVLEKNGFTFAGAGSEEGVILFRLPRDDYQRRGGPGE